MRHGFDPGATRNKRLAESEVSHATDVTFKKAQRVRYEPSEKQQVLPMEGEPQSGLV